MNSIMKMIYQVLHTFRCPEKDMKYVYGLNRAFCTKCGRVEFFNSKLILK